MDDFYTFGWGKYGQLGHGDEYNVYIPKIIDRSSLHGQGVTSLSCGFNFNIAVTQKGDVYTWGYGKNGNLAQADMRNFLLPRRVKELQKLGICAAAAGNEHSLAMTKDGNIYSWGCGCYGLLGRGGENDDFKPSLIPYFGPESLNNIIVTKIACGLKHSLALDKENQVYSWGFGGNGRLGHGNEDNCLTPKKIATFDPLPKGSSGSVLEMNQEESKNSNNEVTNILLDPAKDGKAKDISCGWKHSCVITTKGFLYTFGFGRDGALGQGEHGYDVLYPLKITKWVQTSKKRGKGNEQELPSGNIKSIACGGKHNIALSTTGEVYSWGRGELGRLGHGDEETKYSPYLIEALQGKDISAVSAGGYHSIVLTGGGHIYTFGNGEFGRLGHNDSKNCLLPMKVENMSDRKVTGIFAGSYITCINAESHADAGKSIWKRCTIL